LPAELPPSLEVPEPLSEVSEPELDPDPEPDPESEPDPEPELDPESEPELEPAPLSTPSWEALEEEPPQPARTAAAIRTTYGEVGVNLFAISPLRFIRWSLPPLRRR
jgi:hypothetical protein